MSVLRHSPYRRPNDWYPARPPLKDEPLLSGLTHWRETRYDRRLPCNQNALPCAVFIPSIVRRNPCKSLMTPMCVSMLGIVSKVSRQCSRSSTGSLSLTSRGRAKQRYARRWRRARLALCRSLQTSPRCERVRSGVGPDRRGPLCRPAWQEDRAPGQRETIWQARGNDPRPCAESPAHPRPASRMNGR